MQYLRSLDFSAGTPRGVKKLEEQLSLENGLENIHELKPLDAVGLPTSTPLAKNIRVLFLKLPDNTLGFLDMVDRRDMRNRISKLQRAARNARHLG